MTRVMACYRWERRPPFVGLQSIFSGLHQPYFESLNWYFQVEKRVVGPGQAFDFQTEKSLSGSAVKFLDSSPSPWPSPVRG